MSRPSNLPQLDKGEASTGASLQPMGFADILDAMFSIYRNHFRLFVSICGVYFLWITVLNLLTSIFTALFASYDQFHMFKFAENGLILVSAVVMLLVKGGLVVGSAQTFLGRRVTTSAALKQAKRRFLPYVGSNLLYGIVVGLFTVTLIGIYVAPDGNPGGVNMAGIRRHRAGKIQLRIPHKSVNVTGGVCNATGKSAQFR